jgi:hypothetical protein
VHVTLRWAEPGRAARERVGRDALEAAVRAAAAATGDRADFHVFHASIRADGAHLLAQADSGEALSSGLQAFSAAAARRVNRATCRLGPVFAAGHDVQVLRTSAEFREALRFLIGRER